MTVLYMTWRHSLKIKWLHWQRTKKKTWTVLIVVGHYLYVEMDDGGYADAGILQSPFFPAPTASVWDSSSPMYGKCQVR